MKLYEVFLDETRDVVISVVEKPAIEVDFLTFSKEEGSKSIPLHFQERKLDNEKRIIMGPVLIPNLEIEREGGYFIFFSKDTIRNIQLHFMKSLSKRNSISNIQHNDKLSLPFDKLFLIECWVKEYEDDKSNKFFNNPIGTLYMSMKVEDELLWEMFKKSELKGFSIEGWFNLNKIEEMNVESLKDLNGDFFDFFNK